MDYNKWLDEVEAYTISTFGEDKWYVWQEDSAAWEELYDQEYSPTAAVHRYKKSYALNPNR